LAHAEALPEVLALPGVLGRAEVVGDSDA
jgi:hypothetical protein